MSAPPAEPRHSARLLWVLIGATGLLGLIMLAACAGLTLISLRNLAAGTGPVAVTAPPLPAPSPARPDPATPAGPDDGADVLLRETFDRPAASDFAPGEDDLARYSFEEGGYTVAVKARDTVVWTLARGRYDDVAVSVDTLALPDYGLSAAGVVFHYQDEQNFYLFQVSGDGYYMLELLVEDEFTTLIDWTQSDAIESGANHLRVEARGDRIGLYVNGRRLEETRDGTFTRGAVGVATSSFDEPSAAIRFDNLVIARVSPGAISARSYSHTYAALAAHRTAGGSENDAP
jgi:hypothetical protein